MEQSVDTYTIESGIEDHRCSDSRADGLAE